MVTRVSQRGAFHNGVRFTTRCISQRGTIRSGHGFLIREHDFELSVTLVRQREGDAGWVGGSNLGIVGVPGYMSLTGPAGWRQFRNGADSTMAPILQPG